MSASSSLSNYPVTDGPATELVMSARTASIFDTAIAGDGITVHITGTEEDLPMDLDYLLLRVEGLGESTPLKQ